jgi:hypothetical protein
LVKAGWLKAVRETPSGITVYEITEAARIALLTIPDDLKLNTYPSPADIQVMKARLRADLLTLVLMALQHGRSRAHKENTEYLPLERAGWLKTVSSDGRYVTHILTDTAKDLLLNTPDELLVYEELVIDLDDIRLMKARLRERQNIQAESSGATLSDR